MTLLISPTRIAHSGWRRLRDWWRGETDATCFDIYAPRMLDPILNAHGVDPLIADPELADQGTDGAARYILALLARSRRLRRRFPDALSRGSDGPLIHWFRQHAHRLGLTDRGMSHIQEAMALGLGEKGKRVLEVRRDLREVFPLALTPMGRGEFLVWLLAHGRRDLGLTDVEVLWFLFESDEDPTRGLESTYRLTPEWQRRFPDGLCSHGWPQLKTWLAQKHQLRGRWFRTVQAPGRPDRVADLGVNLLAHYRYTSGLQQAALGVDRALCSQGMAVTRRDLPVVFDTEWADRERYLGLEEYDTSIVTVAANSSLTEFAAESGLHLRDGVHRIAVWYWELAQMPAGWSEFAQQVDEIWAPTEFIASAMRASTDRPVHAMPPGMELPRFTPRPRESFGLNPEGTLFLFVFDMASVMKRKNPLAVIDAFRQSFRADEPAQLAIKVVKANRYPSDRTRLFEHAARAGVSVIDREFTRADHLALMNLTDCYVSLHRSEGLGLTMAEAMALGKPVIATGYSGNLDFMTHANSLLVDHRIVAIEDDHGPYPKGYTWAEPSIEHAATLMRWVFDHPNEAKELGHRAQEDVAKVLSVESAGKRMVARLRELRQRRIIK